MRIRHLSGGAAALVVALGLAAAPAAAAILAGVSSQGQNVYVRTTDGDLTRVSVPWSTTCATTGASFSERLIVTFRVPVKHGFDLRSPATGTQDGLGYSATTVLLGSRHGSTWSGRLSGSVRLTRHGRFYDRCAVSGVTWTATPGPHTKAAQHHSP